MNQTQPKRAGKKRERKKTKMILFRVNSKEHRLFKKRAKERKLTVSDYIRAECGMIEAVDEAGSHE